jgi:hypothetical protein
MRLFSLDAYLPRSEWEGYIEIKLNKIGYKDVDWINLNWE